MSQLPANHQENMRRTGNVYGIDQNTGKHWSIGLGLAKPPSGQLGGQIKPSPYSAPPQMGGGFGGQMGGQGMQQFMQFMQTMMQMFQQFQGGGGRGMGGGFGEPPPFRPQQRQYGQYQPQRMSNQFNPNNAFGGY
jgi:hypothetical protein